MSENKYKPKLCEFENHLKFLVTVETVDQIRYQWHVGSQIRT